MNFFAVLTLLTKFILLSLFNKKPNVPQLIPKKGFLYFQILMFEA